MPPPGSTTSSTATTNSLPSWKHSAPPRSSWRSPTSLAARSAAWVAERIAEAADPALAEEAYAKGLFSSGSICLQVVATSTQADADAVIVDLVGGSDFADVFAASNVDPALAQSSGRIGCLAIGELALGVDNPLVESITTINAADPYALAVLPGATPDEDLYVVSRFIPYEELGPDETPVVAAALNADALGLDIYIDPADRHLRQRLGHGHPARLSRAVSNAKS